MTSYSRLTTRLLPLALLTFSLMLATDHVAQSSPTPQVIQEGALDTIVENFRTQTQTWASEIQKFAQNLLFSLMAISLLWIGLQAILKRQELQDIIQQFVMLVLTVSFYLIVMWNVGDWVPNIVSTFGQIAGSVIPDSAYLSSSSASPEFNLSASQVVGTGWDVFSAMRKVDIPPLDIASRIFLGFAGLVIVILFAGIAAYLMLVMIEGWVVVAGGLIFLGFAGSEFTLDIAKNYLKYILSFAVKLYAAFLIVAVGVQMIDAMVLKPLEGWVEFGRNTANWSVAMVFIHQCVFFAIVIPLVILVLTFSIPAVFQQIAGGMGSHSNFAMNSVLTTTLMSAASVGRMGLGAAMNSGQLLQGAGGQGLQAMKALGPNASPAKMAGAFGDGASQGMGGGLKAAAQHLTGKAGEAFSGNEGSLQKAVHDHFSPPSPDKQ